jgi:hypothetical protein
MSTSNEDTLEWKQFTPLILQVISIFLVQRKFSEPFSFCVFILYYGRWNIVSILVLLCQGLLFQNANDSDQAVLIFGILVIVIICFCIASTMYSVSNTMLRPEKSRRFLLQRSLSRRLPWDILLELYFLHCLGKLDFDREIELDMNEMQSMMTKAEFQETKSSIESMDDIPQLINIIRNTSESTNSRVMWWSLLQTIVLIGSGLYQIRHLQTFFKKKKLV